VDAPLTVILDANIFMLISGFQKLTLLDYPDHVAALIFAQGCNFACGYCHNPEMIPSFRILPVRPEFDPKWILSFLEKRKGLLDGVVISGGEPTLQENLPLFLQTIKDMGFLIKLDTNGSRPEILSKLIDKKLLDYVAMDIKAPIKDYPNLVKNRNTKSLLDSIQVIMNSQIDYEFRSTIFPSLHGIEEIKSMGKLIRGAKRWYLQNFRPLKTLDRSFKKQSSFSTESLLNLQSIARHYACLVGIRG